MVQQTSIELVTGLGRGYRRLAAAVWIASAILLLALAGRLPSLAVCAGILALLSEWPGRREVAADKRVRLHRDGALEADGRAGSWQARGWSTTWLTVLAPRAPAGQRLLIASWRNDPGDYRVLRTWLRHPPEQGASATAAGQRP